MYLYVPGLIKIHCSCIDLKSLNFLILHMNTFIYRIEDVEQLGKTMNFITCIIHVLWRQNYNFSVNGQIWQFNPMDFSEINVLVGNLYQIFWNTYLSLLLPLLARKGGLELATFLLPLHAVLHDVCRVVHQVFPLLVRHSGQQVLLRFQST